MDNLLQVSLNTRYVQFIYEPSSITYVRRGVYQDRDCSLVE